MGGYYTSGDLKGYWFTAADMGGSTISPKDFAINSAICASGTAAMVTGMAFSTTWGTLLGYNINQAMLPPNDPATKALSASGTVNVTLSGTVPAGTRLKVAINNVDYCKEISSGANAVKLSDLKKECWTAGGASYAGEPVAAIGIQVSTAEAAAKSFNFCVTSFSYAP